MKLSDLYHEKFRGYIAEETKCLREACNSLKEKEKSEDIPEALLGEINVCCGQSELLIKKRFVQFATLIDDSELKRSEKEITHEDLHGFWDIIMIQVDDIKNKIEKAKTVENEELPLIENIPKAISVKIERKKMVAVSKKSKVEASSGKTGIRNHILAMRRAMNQKESQNGKDVIVTTFENGKENISCNENNLSRLKTTPLINIENDARLSSKKVKKTPISRTPATKKTFDVESSSKRIEKTPDTITPRSKAVILSSHSLKKQMLLSPMIHKDYSPCIRVTRSMKKRLEDANDVIVTTFENGKENISCNENNLSRLKTTPLINIENDAGLSSKEVKKTPISRTPATKKTFDVESSSKRIEKTPDTITPRSKAVILSSHSLKKQMLLSPMIHKDYSPCIRVTRSMKKRLEDANDVIVTTFENGKENISCNENNLNRLKTTPLINIENDAGLSSKKAKKTPISRTPATKKTFDVESSSKRIKKTPDTITPRSKAVILSSHSLEKQMLLSPMIHKDYSPCIRVTRSMKKGLENANESL